MQKRNDKSYQGTEKSEEEAKKAFNKTVAAIKKHNADPSATYQQGTNENSDMTDDERKKRNGYKHTSEQNKSVKKIKPKVHGTTPASYNVTSWMAPAKDQGSCGKTHFFLNFSNNLRFSVSFLKKTKCRLNLNVHPAEGLPRG